MESSTDHIEKEIVLRAPVPRVWQAISDAEEFGKWFGLDLEGKRFTPEGTVSGRITYPGFEHLICEMRIDRVEPERLFSYRWHPYAVDRRIDYSQEPMTLVVFTLEPEAGGTRLRIVESGFDRIPLGRQAEAFRMNSRGWEMQTENIAKHVAAP